MVDFLTLQRKSSLKSIFCGVLTLLSWNWSWS